MLEIRISLVLSERIELDMVDDLANTTEHVITVLGSSVLVRRINTSCYNR